jgi:hypothetical protein
MAEHRFRLLWRLDEPAFSGVVPYPRLLPDRRGAHRQLPTLMRDVTAASRLLDMRRRRLERALHTVSFMPRR